MRKAWALFSALLVMLASLVPSLAPIAARAQGGASAVITIHDAGPEAFLRGIAHPLFRAAGVDPALVRITLVQARPINAFATSGNRMFRNTGPTRWFGSPAGGRSARFGGDPGRLLAGPPGDGAAGCAQDLRAAARRDNLTQEQRELDDAMRRRQAR